MINVADYVAAAAAKVDPSVWCYFEGGAGDEVTLRANVAAYGRWQFRPRVLVDVGEVTTATTLLGTPVSMPLGIAPFAMQRLVDPEGEVATARAASAADVLLCVSTLTTSTHAEIGAAGDGPRWLQLYVLRDRRRTLDHIHEAREAGYTALVLTVDLPYVGRRERDLRLGFQNPPPDLHLPYASLFETSPTLTWRDLEWIRSEMPLPLVLKGILTREDAVLAVEHGADAVWVSNHGGRQLDGVAAGLDALAEVAEAVGGRCELYVDGGVRRGGDVLKALALGARAAFAARAFACALAVDGEQGVANALVLLRDEIQLGLGLLGCTSPGQVARSHVEPAHAFDLSQESAPHSPGALYDSPA
jgi:4-hydroxymandelate oxidase